MFDAINIILIGTAVTYCIQISRWMLGIMKLRDSVNDKKYTVDVLVAARNEKRYITQCIQSLLQQDYPSEKYHITVIDDQSDDSTADVVRNLCEQYPDRISLLIVQKRDEHISPKINALSHAIALTTNEIIATTDADCVVTSNWLSTIVKNFADDIGVITGMTKYADNPKISPLLFGIQYLDYISHNAVSAGSIGIRSVNTASGCNMAYRREAFTAIDGFNSFKHINSGYDSFLTQKIAATKRWRALYISAPTAFVTTYAVESWKEFLFQRMRWSAQTADYRWTMMFFMISTFVLYCILPITMALSLTQRNIVPWIVFAVMGLFDFVIVWIFTAKYNITKLMRYFILAMVIHIPFTLAAVFGGYFTRYEWKKRKVGRKN